jgi:hypothetical protein
VSRRRLTALVVALLAGAGPAAAQPGQLVGSRNGSPIWVRASIEPSVAPLGVSVIYRGRATITYAETRTSVKWMLPERDSTMTWGTLKPRITHSQSESRTGKNARLPNHSSAFADTLIVEATLQVFRTGIVTIPGLRFQFQDPVHPQTFRLPAQNLIVTSILTPADSNADLRPMRGPLAAPWWERVPWVWVALGLLLALGVIAFFWWRKRRRPVTAIPTAAPAPIRRLDPAAEALAALAALRAQGLPARGRFAEHAFELSRIARRFLEATAGTTRPGDTTPELVRHLEGSGLGPEDVQRVASLLRAWDRVKFARAASTVDEARREEEAVEALARRRAEPAERVA